MRYENGLAFNPPVKYATTNMDWFIIISNSDILQCDVVTITVRHFIFEKV
jgi:hypothetical protein